MIDGRTRTTVDARNCSGFFLVQQGPVRRQFGADLGVAVAGCRLSTGQHGADTGNQQRIGGETRAGKAFADPATRPASRHHVRASTASAIGHCVGSLGSPVDESGPDPGAGTGSPTCSVVDIPGEGRAGIAVVAAP